MMALHELGHVVGAVPTGGSIECVVLHPMSFSRTDVSPNLHPAICRLARPYRRLYWSADVLYDYPESPHAPLTKSRSSSRGFS